MIPPSNSPPPKPPSRGVVAGEYAGAGGASTEVVKGRLAVVGLGPGNPGLLTAAAAEELGRATLLVGYSAYLDQVPAAISGARREGFGLGEERARARRAVAGAAQGESVALVSSGDPGIYAMAGIALDEVLELPVEGRPEIVIVPGVTAALAAAALVGAPLAVDFACLSLSDLLLPWPELEAKLRGLAHLDLVLALYNPASRARRTPWETAVALLQGARPASTPVAAVRRAYRSGQSIELSEVAHLHELEVDMETVVIVGSSRTRRVGDWLLTLRDGTKAES